MKSAPAGLVEAPFHRRAVLARLEALLERYAKIIEWHRGDRTERRLVGRELLLRHPSALREALEIDLDEAEDRQLAVRREIERVRGAAPLPPPEAPSRRLHALSELEPLMREVRRRRRKREESEPDELAAAELGPELDALAVAPSHEHLGTLVSWLAVRYGIPGWWTWVWGPRGEELDVGAVHDFVEGRPRRVQGPEGPVLVVARPEGWYAASAECPHRGGDLTEGELDGPNVICPVHGWSFSLVDGSTPVDPGCKLPIYEVRVVEGRVRVRAVSC